MQAYRTSLAIELVEAFALRAVLAGPLCFVGPFYMVGGVLGGGAVRSRAGVMVAVDAAFAAES